MQLGEDMFGMISFASTVDENQDPVSWYEICNGSSPTVWTSLPSFENDLVRCGNGS